MTTDNSFELPKQPVPYTQRIVAQLPTDRPTYLILDGAGFNALSLIFANGVQPEFMLLYTHTELAEQLNISPVIVRYDNNPDLQSKYATWQPHAVAFQTTADLASTVEHLKSLIYCQLPNTQPAFFRFYGQNWLESLITEQNQSTLYPFTGPIDRWYIPQAEQGWQQLTITQQSPCKTAEDYAWFKLTEELQAKLANTSAQRFINELMIELGYNQLPADEQTTQREKLNYYLQEANNYGITQTNQISHFIELALQFPKDIQKETTRQLLSDQSLMAYQKLQQLENQLYGLA